MPYPEQMVAPMRAELTTFGVQELRDAAAVDAWFADKSGTAVLLINSVCGCAAGSARPALKLALEHPSRPTARPRSSPARTSRPRPAPAS